MKRAGDAAPRQAVQGGGHLWFVTAPAFARLREIDPSLAAAVLNHRESYMLGGGKAVRRLWRGRVRAQYESYVAFAEDVQHGNVDTAVTAVAYNPEVWAYTPEGEQRDPVAYAGMFASLTRQHAWTAIIAPSCSLLRKMPGGWRGSVFEGCAARLLAPLSHFADIVDFEAQAMENEPALYARRVIDAAGWVKRANPRVKFVAQLSTSLQRHPSAEKLVAAARAVQQYVDGFWLNIDSGDPESVALARIFLEKFNAAPH